MIGIGNTLRRDDAIGIIVLEYLLKFYQRKDIDYFDFHSTGSDLLHQIKDYDNALVIDGINAGFCVGELKVGELKDIYYKLDNSLTFTHEFDLRNIFELSKELKIKTKIYLAGIQIQDTSFGEGLSEALEEKKEDIVKEVIVFIEKTFP